MSDKQGFHFSVDCFVFHIIKVCCWYKDSPFFRTYKLLYEFLFISHVQYAGMAKIIVQFIEFQLILSFVFSPRRYRFRYINNLCGTIQTMMRIPFFWFYRWIASTIINEEVFNVHDASHLIFGLNLTAIVTAICVNFQNGKFLSGLGK